MERYWSPGECEEFSAKSSRSIQADLVGGTPKAGELGYSRRRSRWPRSVVNLSRWQAHGSAGRSGQRRWISTGRSGPTRHQVEDGPGREVGEQKQGQEAELSYNGNLLVENRNGLIVKTEVFEANGTAERDAALIMLEHIPGTKRVTVGGYKAYDTADFVVECRNLKVTPHVAQNLEPPGGSAIDARTTQHLGMASVRGRGSALKNASDG
jgi:hypothetical protein